MGFGNPVVWDAWVHMNSPRRRSNKNARFYFTEEGWRRYGRKTIEVCQQVCQRYQDDSYQRELGGCGLSQ